MSIKNLTATKTLKAEAAISENRVVKLGTNALQVITAGAGEDAIGVAQHGVALDEEISIEATPGAIVKCVASAAITLGARVMAAANGKIVTATAPAAAYAATRVRVLGIALEAASADNDVISVLWMPTERT